MPGFPSDQCGYRSAYHVKTESRGFANTLHGNGGGEKLTLLLVGGVLSRPWRHEAGLGTR